MTTERAPPTHLDQAEREAIARRFAAIRERELDKRRRTAERRRRRRFAAVRKLPPLRRPAVEASSALVRFQARLAARRRQPAPLRQPVPAPEAVPQRPPSQDLAAEVEAGLERLGAEHHAERERQYAAHYGADVVQLAREYLRVEVEHGPSGTQWLTLDPGAETPNQMRIHDDKTIHYTGTHSPATVARALSLCAGQPLNSPEIPKMERKLAQTLARQRALQRQRTPGS